MIVLDNFRLLEGALVGLFSIANGLYVKCICRAEINKPSMLHEIECPLGALALLQQGLKKQGNSLEIKGLG